MVGWVKNFFNQVVWPGYYSGLVDKKTLSPRYKAIEATTDFDLPDEILDDLIEQLKREVKEQSELKKGLEDKIKSILFVISLSITAITFCLKDLEWNRGNVLNVTGLLAISLSIIYFLASAMGSIKALIPIPFHETSLRITYDKESKRIKYEKGDDELKVLLKSKLLNETINNRIQNTAYTVLQYLKNGMVLFAIFFGSAILQKITQLNGADPSTNISTRQTPVAIKMDSLRSKETYKNYLPPLHRSTTKKNFINNSVVIKDSKYKGDSAKAAKD